MHTRARLAAAAAIALSLTSCSQLPASPDIEESSPEIDRSAMITTRIDHVVDGDTVVVEAVEPLPITDPGTNTSSIRLLSIQAPEMHYRDNQDPDCGAQEATDALDQLLPAGAEVQITFDDQADTIDRYDRVLGYIETADNIDAGEQMITEGWAVAWHPDSGEQPERFTDYDELTREAENSGAGMFTRC